VVLFGDIKSKTMMIITDQNLIFAGWTLSSKPQEVNGIFVSAWYAGSTLKNDLTTRRWIDDGRLVINGIVIGPNIQDLSNRRRSVIENWYSWSWTNMSISSAAIVAKRKTSLIEWASLRITPNPKLFTSPPPGADELFKSLNVAK
jgi:hypothetical protein